MENNVVGMGHYSCRLCGYCSDRIDRVGVDCFESDLRGVGKMGFEFMPYWAIILFGLYAIWKYVRCR